ncbi:hypothetical protein CYMTET_8866 [Cymbomonas tetramitiformis]|uniref:FHA domain-containing protein n=1 Tax=Cymbomonas tetramitiformis TaxID=36881 RepID=A0AAE0GS71_9CHLO|nr:hypothetical protein CYMTET_8866 [Cymbomonas tetramitiformis]
MYLSACTAGTRVIRSRVERAAPVRCAALSHIRHRHAFKGIKLASGSLKATFLGTPAAVCCQPSRAHRASRRVVKVSALFGGRGTQSSNGNLSGYELRGSPTIKLPKGNTIVGRDEDDSDIVVNKAAVSNKHCRFSAGPRGVTLTDLGSTNGTFVDGKQVKGSVSLSPGDKVTLGNVKFTLVEKKPPAPKAPAQGTTRGSVRAGTTRGTTRGGTTRGTIRGGTTRGSVKAGSQVVQRGGDAQKVCTL